MVLDAEDRFWTWLRGWESAFMGLDAAWEVWTRIGGSGRGGLILDAG